MSAEYAVALIEVLRVTNILLGIIAVNLLAGVIAVIGIWARCT